MRENSRRKALLNLKGENFHRHWGHWGQWSRYCSVSTFVYLPSTTGLPCCLRQTQILYQNSKFCGCEDRRFDHKPITLQWWPNLNSSQSWGLFMRTTKSMGAASPNEFWGQCRMPPWTQDIRQSLLYLAYLFLVSTETIEATMPNILWRSCQMPPSILSIAA